MRIISFLTAMAFCSIASAQSNTQTEPTRIRIGETILTLQSPLRVQSVSNDSLSSSFHVFSQKKSKYPRTQEEIYFGFGFPVPVHNAPSLPVQSRSSFNLEVGYRYLYKPSKSYTIGTFLQYSCYSYRTKEASEMFMGALPAGDIQKEFFRTDNLGTGLIQRIRLFNHIQLEAMVYGDWAYSKRFVVKSKVNNHKEKTKYRDDLKFSPFGAGAQAGLRWGQTTFYARYRFTNFFNSDYISNEAPRLSIGISFGL